MFGETVGTLSLDEYQSRAVDFAMYPDNIGIAYTTLGLTGEAGEVAEKVKKYIRKHGSSDLSFGGLIRNKGIAKELGDVLWYLANLSNELGYTLQEIAEINLNKLNNREKRDVIVGEGDNR